MTRETLPRFDLYGELEVSPFASVGTIEAAFRSLVKQHHPDLESGNESRMRRLNLAREWLTDPELRHRYDQETDRGQHIPEARRPVATHSVVTRSHAERRAASGWSPPAAGAASRDSEPTFGIHADDVRQFLAELRSLDRARAQRVWNGRAVAHTRGYTQALRAAASAARGGRKAEWQFAREAASVIARGKLGDSTLTDQVADVLSDIAGAIAIRDLLSPSEFSLVLMPWTWRGTVRMPDVETPVQAATAPAATVPTKQAVEDRSSLDNARRPVEVPLPGLKSEASFAATLMAARAAPPAANVAPAASVDVQPASVAQPAPVAQPASVAQPAPAQPAPVAPVMASKPVPPPKPAAPFVAAVAPASTPPSWPVQPVEPRARPPMDPVIPARLAAASLTATTRPATSIRRARPVRAAVFAAPPRRRIGTFPMVLGGASLILLLGSALLMFPGARPNQVVAAATDAPTGTVPGVAVGSEAPAIADPSSGSGSTDVPPTSTEPPTVGGPTPLPPGPGSTPRPRQPAATAKPTQPGAPATPTPPTPPPTPVPPTATPESLCTVPTLVGLNKADVATAWSAAGFTGAISYVPRGTDWVVGWQSLAIGSTQDCTTGIQVRRTGP